MPPSASGARLFVRDREPDPEPEPAAARGPDGAAEEGNGPPEPKQD